MPRVRFRIGTQTAAAADPEPPVDSGWHVLPVGAGGQQTWMDFADDGTLFVGNDTHGCYIYEPSARVATQVMTKQSLGLSQVEANTFIDSFDSGTYTGAICATDSDRLYVMILGNVWRSSDKGVTWEVCPGWTQRSGCSPNLNTKFVGPYMEIDPINADVMLVGTTDNGAFITSNGGTTFTALTALGTATTGESLQQSGGHIFAFDRNSAQTGGKTQGIYASTYGTGTYKSTNGGTSWTLTTSTPTRHVRIRCDVGGTLWHVDKRTSDSETSGVLRSFNGTTWSSSYPTNGGSQDDRNRSIACDPANVNRVYIGQDHGALRCSTNHGSAWNGFEYTATRVATDVPWLAATNESYMTCGDHQFDPIGSNRLVFTEGIGNWDTNPASSGNGTVYTSMSAGLEQLVGNRACMPTGDDIVLGGWDRPVFHKSKSALSAYPTGHGPNYTNSINHCWDIDYASANPDTIVAVIVTSGIGNNSGISTNGGSTWTNFASQSWYTGGGGGGQGGCIAAASATNFVIASAQGNRPYYTTNGGSSWTQTNPTPTTGWGIGNYIYNARFISADRVAANTFLMHNTGATPGIYRSTDSGASWTRVHTTNLGQSGGGREILRHVPLNSGHAFYSAGDQGGSGNNPAAGSNFKRTTDQGATWSNVSNVLEVKAFGFCAPAAGGYPGIGIIGYVGGVFGAWVSDDNCATWDSIGDGYPDGSLDFIKWLEGDPDGFNRWIVAFNGSGWGYYEPE